MENMNRLEREIIETSGNKALMQELYYSGSTLNKDLEYMTHITNDDYDFGYDCQGPTRDDMTFNEETGEYELDEDAYYYDPDAYYDYDDGRNPMTLASYAGKTRIAYLYPELADLIFFCVSDSDLGTSKEEYFYDNSQLNFAPKSSADFKKFVEEEFDLSFDDVVAQLEKDQNASSCGRNLIEVLDSFEKNFHFVPKVAPQFSAGIHALYNGYAENMKVVDALSVTVGDMCDLDEKKITIDDCVKRFDRKAITPIANCENIAFITLAALGYVNPNNMPAAAKDAFIHCASVSNIRDVAKISEIFKNIPKNVKQADIISILENPDVAKRYIEKINGSHQVTIPELAQEIRTGWMEQEKYKFEQEYGFNFADNYINIAGAENVIEMAGMKAYILPANDLRNFTVGYDTFCCQHYGGAGESCVAAAVDRDNTGIFVIEKNGKIEAQAFVWTHGHAKADGSFVFDSIMFDNIEFANDQNLNRHNDVVRGYEEGMSIKDYEALKNTIAFEGILAAYVENLPYDNVYMGMGYNQMGMVGGNLSDAELIGNTYQSSGDISAVIKTMVNEAIGDTYTDFDYRARVLKEDGVMWMEHGMEMKEKDGTMIATDALQYHLGKQDLHNPEVNIFEHANVVGLTNYKGDKRYIVEVANGSKQVLAGDLSKFLSIRLDESLLNDPSFNIAGTAVKDVVFPEGITALNNALGGVHFCKEPKLPDTLEVLGDCALVNTSGYTDLTIPDSVKEIGSAALSDCSDLKGVWLPEGLEKLAPDCFDYTELEFLSMSDNIFRDSEVPDKIFNWANIERVAIKDTCGKAAKMAYNMIKSGDVGEVEFDGCTQMYVDKYDVGDMSFKEFEKNFVKKGHREKDYER